MQTIKKILALSILIITTVNGSDKLALQTLILAMPALCPDTAQPATVFIEPHASTKHKQSKLATTKLQQAQQHQPKGHNKQLGAGRQNFKTQ